METSAGRFWPLPQRLLSQLPIGWRLAIAIAVLLLPLALLGYQYVGAKSAAIEVAKLERSGLTYLGPLHRFMRHVADHRGMTYRYMLGDRPLLKNIRDTEAKIELDLAQLDAQDGRFGARLKVFPKSSTIRSVWDNFRNVALYTPAQDGFAVHTALIAAALELNDHVAETSGLVLDARAEAYYLMDAVVLRGPQFGENIGQLRGSGAGLLQNGNPDSADRIAIASKIAVVRDQFGAIRQSLGRAYHYSVGMEAKLTPGVEATESALAAFLGQAEKLARGDKAHFLARDFFAAGTRSLDEYGALNEAADAALEAKFDDLIAALEQDRKVAIGLVAGIILLAFLVSVAIVGSVVKPVRHLRSVVERLARGDSEARARLDIADEIGLLGRQFDRMMDALKKTEAGLRESEAHYKSLTEIFSDDYWESDEHLRHSRVILKDSRGAAARENFILGKTLWELPESAPLSGSWADHQATLAEHRSFRDFEIRYIGSGGGIRYASISGAPLFDADGGFKGYHGLTRNITAQKTAEQKIRDSEADLAAAQQIAQVGSWTIDFSDTSNQGNFGNQGNYADSKATWSDEIFRILGYEPGEIDASPMNFVKAVHPADQELVMAPISRLLETGEQYEVEHRIVRPDGSERIVLSKGNIFVDPVTEKPVKFIGTTQDITERKRAEEQLAYLAQFDMLTGLPNRHRLYDQLNQALAGAKRVGEQIACMFVDLDRFKNVNDTFGHSVGDKLLLQVAGRLRECLRGEDLVGRLGGDEFAVVLTHIAKADDASLVAQKIIAALAAPFDLGGHEAFISASIGISISPDDAVAAEDLLRNADTAMYRAKEQGRNNHQFYKAQMNDRVVERQKMEAELHGAVERGELLLYYQPKVELGSGGISGFEALLRWRHPTRGMVSPVEFVPALEDTGLIVPVGEWVLRTACAQISSWQAQGLVAPQMAINLSARQFQQKALDAFISCIVESGVSPALIKLELTESLLMKEAEEAVQSLARLKALGVRLSVDDFGTGYSSLAYLKRFPLDEIKIDRAFIRDVTINPEDAEITLTIINLAHSLSLTVLAEGVETEAQLRFLHAHGCDEVQGYYFSEPVSAEDCTRMLAEGRRLKMPVINDASEEMPTLLVVDDNPADLELMQRALVPGGYRVLVADSPRAAFEALVQNRVRIVISDHHMPGMTGVNLLARVRKLYPDAIRIAMSGDSGGGVVTDAVNEAGIHKYLSKDWDAARLRMEVREAYLRGKNQPA